MAMSNRQLLPLVLISLVLAGCVGDSVIPPSSMTMVEIYDEHNRQASWNRVDIDSARSRIGRPSTPGDVDLAGYTREAQTEIAQLFPKLPNPDLVMYVFPHMAGEGNYPVPGYSTTFSLYEQDYYALPGE